MIVIEGIRIIPTVFLMVIGLFRTMDPALEEAAASTGAGTWTTLRKVTLPMMLPGILAVLIYMCTGLMGAFEIPALLGMQDGVYVFSTRIYVATHKMPRDYGLAGSLSTVFAITAIIGILLYHRMLRVQQRFATVTGKAFRPRVMDLGRLRYVGATAIILYFVFIVLIPGLILIWASLQPFYQVPSPQALRQVSLDAYWRLFSMPWLPDALRNTGILLLVVPTAVMGLSAVVSWIVVRTGMRGRKLLDSLVFLPHTMPSIVIGLSFLWMYLVLDFIPIYGTIWLISLAMLTSFLAFGTRTTNAAMYQLHQDLEEAGSVTGASWFTVFRKITLPLLVPTLIGGWVWVAIHAVRELTVALMLASPQSRIVSVLIWNFWETGDTGMTAATGVLLILFIASILTAGRLISVKMFKAS
jgi:iron(III) transport system permease protein